MFEILTYKKRFDANKVELVENCGHPYVVRTSSGNGQKGFIDEDEIYLNDGNTISFGQDTATMYYQEVPYFTGDKIKILKSKLSRFGKTNAQFFLATMRNSFQNFTWGSSSFNVSIIANQRVQLPLKEKSLDFSNPCDNIKNIDFDFMESFIRELEEERIRELNAYLLATGLKDYALS
ncbi:MAG: restriction endonuclease subunit S, partial [Treponema sp.]|nr:restriction endonuclease subunit S [Treponema sp.]